MLRIPPKSCCLFLVIACGASTCWAEEPLEPIAAYKNGALPLLRQYCFDCHEGEDAESGMAISELQGDEQFQQDRQHWKSVLFRLEAGDMPPADYDAPTEDQRKELIGWIKAKLQQIDCSQAQDPGWVTLRRLNRDQYRNTIRDLLGIEFEPSKSFPPDTLAYGFDNNADVLTLTPVLLEKYLAAATEISRQAIRTPETANQKVSSIPREKWQGGQYDSGGRRELWTTGSIEFVYKFDKPGRHWLRVHVSASQAGDEPVKMSLMLRGKPVQTVDVYATEEESEVFAFAFDAPEGKLRLGVAFRNDFYDEAAKLDRNLYVEKLELIESDRIGAGGSSQAYRRWFSDEPKPADWRTEQAWRSKVEETLQTFLNAAYRRPAPQDEINRVLGFIDSRRVAGDSYQQAMQTALEVILVSPRFLYIGNVDDPPRQAVESQRGYEIDEYELASRLSYFLWSTTPDTTLLRLAKEGALREQLPAQVTRLLRDRRSEQFTNNFSGQWLGTRLLADIEPDEAQFAGFDDKLRLAMQREAAMLFADVVRQDLPITTLIDADFTYLNEQLAGHYGIEGVRGQHFRRVLLSELAPFPGVRGGILTMAAMLATTSNPDRTSPVKRGKWVLAELLAEPPPEAPPGIESLESVAAKSDKALSIREQMEVHRANPACISCHRKMDPIGLALENYDLAGRWRSEDGTGTLDVSGELPGGEKINGVTGLRDWIVGDPAAFRRAIAEKMLTYALGRGLEYYDECTLREITDRTKEEDDRIQTMILSIVESVPFQQRRYENRPTSP